MSEEKMSKENVESIFILAGVKILGIWRLENQYWPRCEGYDRVRAESPWWLIKTREGMIKIGWRKRVISIDWSDTGLCRYPTKDDTTMTSSMVHAWTVEKAIEYLKALMAD